MSLAKEFKERLESFLANPNAYVEALSDEDKDKYLTNFGGRCKDAIVKQFFDNGPRYGDRALSPSSLGKCVRSLAYSYHHFQQEPLTAKTRMTFLTGDLLEAVIYTVAELSGWAVENIQKEVYPFGEEVGVKGSIDGTLGDYVLDVKSSSKAAFEITAREGVTDTFGYLTQISLYKAGLDKKEAFFVYVNKNTGEIAVHSVEHRPELVQAAKIKYDMVKASTPDRLPPRPYEAAVDKKSKRKCLPMQCKFCSYKTICWNIIDIGKGYNNSEVYYV